MSIRINYESVNPRLEEILQSINRPGEFCTFGRVAKPMPRLEVEKIGVLSFPVPEMQIKQLIKTADRAPYGKGAQTLVDASVRNCWEINVDQFSLGGRSWDKTVRHFENLAADGLGCPRNRLSSQLYKLLFYKTGGFFVPHRDTEKCDGMIATLTVSLPVQGTGGELVVQHRDREMTIEMNVDDPSELAYAAFYSDCQHEIKKIRSGHRIALVYNLCLEPDDDETFRAAPDYTKEVKEIEEELQVWCDGSDENNKLIWILEHQYSQAGLSFDTLKNGDSAIASALHSASEQAECELFASIVHISEIFDAWYSGDEYGYYGDDSPDDYEAGELIERTTWMDSWVSPDGLHPEFGEIHIDGNKLMPAGALDDALPDDEQVDEATGNGGTTLDRAYRFTALVLLRRAGILVELVKESAASGVAWITQKLTRNAGTVDDRIIGLAEKLIDIWPPPIHFSRRSEGISEMLQLLLNLSSQRTSARFLREIAIQNYRGRDNEELATLLSTLEPADTKEILLLLIGEKFSIVPENLLQMLMLLAGRIEYSVSSRQHIFSLCAREILRLLPQTLSQMTKESKRSYKPKPKTLGKDATKNLLMLFWRGNEMDAAFAVPEVLEKYPTVASLDREVPEALAELREFSEVCHSEAYSSLWYISASYLLERSGTPPEPPNDWKIPAAIPCRCSHCIKLRHFCENREQREERFRLRKDLRAHLHQIIDGSQLDLLHETERKGRPYTLVCTKNRATYQRRLKEYAEDVDSLNSLIKVMDGDERLGQVDEKFVKLCTAVELAGQLD